jgi:hypothetical protein
VETSYTADFGDGTYKFWLPMTRIVAAEREMGRDGSPRSIIALFYDIGESLGDMLGDHVVAGPMAAHVSECHAVIRNALIGGNEGRIGDETLAVGDTMARDLVATYCYPARPIMHDIGLAWQILKAAIYGIEISGSKKKGEATDAPSPS